MTIKEAADSLREELKQYNYVTGVHPSHNVIYVWWKPANTAEMSIRDTYRTWQEFDVVFVSHHGGI